MLVGIGAFACAGLAAQADAAVTAQSVAAGERHTCALLSSGHIDCWGYNVYGQLGNGMTRSSDTPVEVQGISSATQVTAGADHTCALLSSGHIDCWGYNVYGQLGNGSTSSSDTPVEVQGISSATEVTAGGEHTCALLSSAHIRCWGHNLDGELGNGTTSSSDTPVEVQGINNATQVTAGGKHTCALLSSSHADCWGFNHYGQLGNDTETNSDTPVEVQGISNATQVTAGADHTCALLSSRHADCWGFNHYGQLGNDTETNSDAPVEVQGISSATEVTAGGEHTCAVLSSSHIDCWGHNFYGQLGNGTIGSSDTPVEVQGISNATQVTAGAEHTCALLSNGHIDCWGNNLYGQLGNGTNGGGSDTPVEVAGISNATQVRPAPVTRARCCPAATSTAGASTATGSSGTARPAARTRRWKCRGSAKPPRSSGGGEHTCALLSGGHIDCWGENGSGELGNGATSSSDTPVEVHGISNATEVTAGYYHTCALLSSGHVDCWGYDFYGELGNGSESEEPDSDTPVEVQGISNATQVTGGGDHTCALLSTGHIDCWGENGSGQLGNATKGEQSDTPVEVHGLSNATQVTGGGDHTCALLSSGHIDCWGENGSGQLGNGSESEESDTPVEVHGISNATEVTAGGESHLRAAIQRSHRLLGGKRLRPAGQRQRKRRIGHAGGSARDQQRDPGYGRRRAHVCAALQRSHRLLGRKRLRPAGERRPLEPRADQCAVGRAGGCDRGRLICHGGLGDVERDGESRGRRGDRLRIRIRPHERVRVECALLVASRVW